jgi:hypothetical protein
MKILQTHFGDLGAFEASNILHSQETRPGCSDLGSDLGCIKPWSKLTLMQCMVFGLP